MRHHFVLNHATAISYLSYFFFFPFTPTVSSDQQQPGGGRPQDFDEDRKLFLGGLSWDTTEEDLQDYFGQFGQVSNVSIKYNAATGNPRGFGFITFANDDSIEAVLNSGPHTVKNKQIDPRKAKSKLNANLKKIFVGGVDSSMTEDELRDYFSRFGRVDGIELPFDKIRNRRREFCFIIFDTKEAADAACQESKQFIGGRDCDIKRAQPQNNNNPMGGGRGMGGGYGGRGGMGSGGYGQGMGGGYGDQQSYGGYGDQSAAQGWGYQAVPAATPNGYQGWNSGGMNGGSRGGPPRAGGQGGIRNGSGQGGQNGSGGGYRSRGSGGGYGNSGTDSYGAY